MKLIPKDALVAEIENLENTYKKCPTRNSYEEGLKDGRLIGYKDALNKIKNLEVREVDLEEEIEEWLHNGDITDTRFDDYRDSDIESTAKHFFELGLKASSNISIEVTSIDEELKENGIDPNSKEAKIIKESYYTAIEKLSAQKGE